MKNKLKFVISALLICLVAGCQKDSNTETQSISFINLQKNSKPDTKSLKDDIVYFKDVRTGLCFAAINSNIGGGTTQAITSITYVPCDSLKRVKLE